MPKPIDLYTQQLQENPFSFNHCNMAKSVKPQFSNSSKTIKLYTQQENPLIKLIKKNPISIHSFSIKIKKKKKGRIQRDKLKLYEAFQQTSSMPTQKPALKNANNNSCC